MHRIVDFDKKYFDQRRWEIIGNAMELLFIEIVDDTESKIKIPDKFEVLMTVNDEGRVVLERVDP